MGQPGSGLGFASEALPDLLLECKLRRKDLDGHTAVEPFIASAIDDAHPTAADLALDGIHLAQRLFQALGEWPVMGLG
jgi:hypothetical protein